ncbi:MAG: PorT family protein [Ferruginibacter sp.]|nr:PorT family protein [Ferruginibacter sp.]
MRKFSAIVFALTISAIAFSQTTPTIPTKLGNRAADHFMVQIAGNFWSGSPDSVSNNIKSFNRSANVYLMYDKQFKNNPRLSAAIGIGVGTSNIYFDKMEVKIAAANPKLPFIRTDTGNNFKKYKLATAFLEIPIELRFMAKPETPNKSIKGAIGIKVGTLLNAHTKGRNLQNAAGTKINGFTLKESSKSYFNTTRIAATARVGYGIFSLFGAYSITNMFKDGAGADIKLVQVGFTISGL